MTSCFKQHKSSTVHLHKSTHYCIDAFSNRSCNRSVSMNAARLLARPVSGQQQSNLVAVTRRYVNQMPLRLGMGRDGWLHVPSTYNPDRPSPLIVMLHGAGASGKDCLGVFDQQELEAKCCIVLLPDSRRSTWDCIRNGFGPDVQFINQALDHVFHNFNIDPTHIALAGFSDGGTYALSLGVPNGDLFSHILALSPGFMHASAQVGRPKIYISHGVHDQVLPINNCSRRLVPRLKDMDYGVKYVEFNGPHTVPHEIAHQALQVFTEDLVGAYVSHY